jgi:hypothetical protein
MDGEFPFRSFREFEQCVECITKRLSTQSGHRVRRIGELQ